MCARWWLTPPGRASTKLFLFLMMLMRRAWAKSVSEANNGLNMVKSWALALLSVAGLCGAPNGSCLLHLRADSKEGDGEIFEGSDECSARVADGKGDEFHPSPVFSEGRDKRGVLFGLFFDLDVTAEVFA